MRILILADIHANHVALDAVWQAVGEQAFDEIWFLGDLFGRGPWPVEVWDSLKAANITVWLPGNWDWILAGMWSPARLAPQWIPGLLWQRQFLQDVGLFSKIADFFRRLDFPLMIQRHGMLATHASFGLPGQRPATDDILAEVALEEYLRSREDFLGAWNRWLIYRERPWGHSRLVGFDRAGQRLPRLMLGGHTHRPVLASFHREARQIRFYSVDSSPNTWYTLSEFQCWYINPGSVGAARGERGFKAEAQFAILEQKKGGWRVQFQRIPYDYSLVQQEIRRFYGDVSRATYGQESLL